jgi:hypothetical protein
MSTTKTTHKTFVRKKNQFIHNEAFVSDDSSDENRSESDNNYDFTDDFLVADSSNVEESKDSKNILSIDFERKRADRLMDELVQCNKKIITLERKLHDMKKLKVRWQQRANLWKKRAAKFLLESDDSSDITEAETKKTVYVTDED